jgi:uncharacterized protein
VIWKKFEKEIKDFVRKRMKGISHGIDHVMRVVKLCKYIGEMEGADLDVLIPAAYLHDIARADEIERGVDHAVEGAKIAAKFLEELGYPEDKVKRIANAISVHRFKLRRTPEDLESKILQDADKLDAIGSIGIYRVIVHSCETNRDIEDTIEHFKEKILKLPELLHTKTAKELAKEREEVVKCFLENLERELRFPY